VGGPHEEPNERWHLPADRRQGRCLDGPRGDAGDGRAGEYAGLDGTAARVWELLARPTTVGGLVDTLTGEYDVSRGECARDVVRCLEDLRRHGIVALGRDGGGSGDDN
jgi:hypothetical protein